MAMPDSGYLARSFRFRRLPPYPQVLDGTTWSDHIGTGQQVPASADTARHILA